jgi:hypothetical protein
MANEKSRWLWFVLMTTSVLAMKPDGRWMGCWSALRAEGWTLDAGRWALDIGRSDTQQKGCGGNEKRAQATPFPLPQHQACG